MTDKQCEHASLVDALFAGLVLGLLIIGAVFTLNLRYDHTPAHDHGLTDQEELTGCETSTPPCSAEYIIANGGNPADY